MTNSKEERLPRLLSIQASPRGDKSISHALSNRFIDHWQHAHPHGTVVHRNLMESNIPYMDNDWISGVYGPPEMVRTPEMNAALALSSKLIAELQAADHLLIGTPMYNFTVPAVLKSWIDYIVRPGFTFKWGEGGLLENKVTRVIVTSRDSYGPGTSNEEADQVSPVLRRVLALIGVTDVEFVLAGDSVSVNRGLVKLEDHLALSERAITEAARA